jgi:hypothetical protein
VILICVGIAFYILDGLDSFFFSRCFSPFGVSVEVVMTLILS